MPPSAPTGERMFHLVQPTVVRRVAFCDFDETYLAHTPTLEQQRSLRELETYLIEAAASGLLFGWVTGSSFASVLAKVERHRLAVLPHFVAASLGTELVFLTGGGARPDPHWQERLNASGFKDGRVRSVVTAVAARGIELTPQPGDAGKEWVASYYYRTRGSAADQVALDTVRAEAEAHGLGVNLSRCNPLAGDPADSYDVDLLPSCCGKRNVVRHVCQRFTVPASAAYAFGDSGNDLEMLASVGHGLLVANATDEARSRHRKVSPHSYAAGVLHALRTETGHNAGTRPSTESPESRPGGGP